MCKKIAKGLRMTHTYLNDMGANIADGTSYNFANTAAGQEWIRNTRWPAITGPIQMVDNSRYLGAHICASGPKRATTLSNRFTKAISMLQVLSRLPIAMHHKAATIRTKIFPMALYGIVWIGGSPADGKRTRTVGICYCISRHSQRESTRYRFRFLDMFIWCRLGSRA